MVWSAFTGLNALAWNYWSFFLLRLGVGVGEASYAPAASSLISDLYPAHRRARATGIYMLGLPVGLVLAFFTVGSMVTAFGSWRAPFVIAALMQVYFRAIEGQTPDPAWDMRLSDASRHFRELKDHALASVGGSRWGAAPGTREGAS